MLVVAFTWGDLWRLALAVFLLAVGLSFAYLLVRLAGTVARLSAFIRGAEESVLPVIGKVGGSVDRVNGQLDKVDRITDSAVDAADSVDTAVRAVSLAVTRPVQKVSGFAAGVSYGAADFKTRHDWRHAVYDDLDDLQVGIEALLALRDDAGELVLSRTADDGVLHASLGPFAPDKVHEGESDGSLGLHRVLDTVCDMHEIEERDGAAWVELTKRIASPAEAGG